MKTFWFFIQTILLSLFFYSTNIHKTFAVPLKKNFKDKDTKITAPLNLRNPFKRIHVFKKKKKHVLGKDLTLTNQKGVENLSIDNIVIVGIVLGKNRRALAKNSSKEKDQNVFILREGMFLENNRAEIKAILPGGIVIVEKIYNVYDQEEYLETIIPMQVN